METGAVAQPTSMGGATTRAERGMTITGDDFDRALWECSSHIHETVRIDYFWSAINRFQNIKLVLIARKSEESFITLSPAFANLIKCYLKIQSGGGKL